MNARFAHLCLAGAFALLAAGLAGADETTAVDASAAARQFDFLLGEWSVTITPKVSTLAAMIHGAPKLVGTWKGWRAFDGRGIEDELRVTDASGNPVLLTRTLRVYDAASARWIAVALDGYRARPSQSSGAAQGGELRVDGSGTTADGKPYLSRTHYLDVRPDGFHVRQDRSYDDGASWEEDSLSIDARQPGADG